MRHTIAGDDFARCEGDLQDESSESCSTPPGTSCYSVVMFFLTFWLQAYPRKLHLCVDGWTSPQVIAFLGVTVHWIHNGHIQSVILDFIK
jgi:hypothetical protein